MSDTANKTVPVGITDFIELSFGPFYVDKTLFIKDYIDHDFITVFTRPNGFGKTTLLSMVKTFFEKTDQDTSVYFKDKAIWQCGEEYTSQQGKYPVLYLDFKNIHGTNWNETLGMFKDLFIQEYRRHTGLKELRLQDEFNQQFFRRMFTKNAHEVDIEYFIRNMSPLLTDSYGIEPVVIVDSYDTPLKAGATYGYYKNVEMFLENLFSIGLSGYGQHCTYALICGELPIYLADMFTGGFDMYNPDLIEDTQYSKYFGFTASESQDLLARCGIEDRMNEVREWYGGYMFGDIFMFNPQSVMAYISHNATPRVYRTPDDFTGRCISTIMSSEDSHCIREAGKMMKGETVCTQRSRLDLDDMKTRADFSFDVLANAGYLTIKEHNYEYLYWVTAIPNHEIFNILDTFQQKCRRQ
ncbi:MAG: AAA family ATPase [Clostridia bacterium]|nr:AAA family ATPase [Clostridia bacterium]